MSHVHPNVTNQRLRAVLARELWRIHNMEKRGVAWGCISDMRSEAIYVLACVQADMDAARAEDIHKN